MLNKTTLIVFPFDPASGVGGRKNDAFRGIVDIHMAIGIKVEVLPLDPRSALLSKLLGRMPVFFGVTVKFLSLLPEGLRRKLFVELIILFAPDIVQALKPDFAYICTMWPIASRVGYEFWRKSGLPYVIQEHRTDFARKFNHGSIIPRAQLDALLNATFVQGLTAPHSREIQAVIPWQSVETLHLALPEDFFVTRRAKENLGRSFSFAAWTNWRQIKRLDLLVEAFELLIADELDVKLRVLGPLSFDGYKNMIDSLSDGARHRVEFVGPVGRTNLRQAIDLCDLCVIPSDHETFGLAAAEALARGVPVLTTECGGPESFIEIGVTGISVSSGSPESLYGGMVQFLQHYSDYSTEHILKSAVEQFSVARVSEVLRQQYIAYDLI